MDLIREIRALEPEMLGWYRHLHENPELGLSLPNTTAFVCDILRNMGIEPTVFPNNTGITALIGAFN